MYRYFINRGEEIVERLLLLLFFLLTTTNISLADNIADEASYISDEASFIADEASFIADNSSKGKSKKVSANAEQARRVFNTAYERVFGPQGSTLTYDVNIIGIYKTHGTIWMKEKKQRFKDERVDAWNNGKTAYMAYRKKHTVEIHNANSDKKDKYSGKFKFSLDDFDYSIANDPEGLLITLKQKKHAKGTIKEVKALIAQGSLAPIRLRIKVAFIWTTVKISNFHSGGINDAMFEFPMEKYKDGWEFVDKRKD